MNNLRLPVAIVMLLLMVYISTNNALHLVLCSHEHNWEFVSIDGIEKITKYEAHHNCSDFLLKLSSFADFLEISLENDNLLICSKKVETNLFLFIIQNHLINALRGPPNYI